ncbi:HAD family hydrolase [Mucilaginibacter daejeonensis]|uniref:HAD family hydrolase n=1 Tax=Mucilaginibacter daejeonensis TaxID=398049 RepID=UPI001D17619E|nr:HAD family hydrolase [Mucilaginibacter daejeonensis]UEG53676.1 HAD family hydrolase [Mucilaginibacter daejeonensis]
MKIKAIFFDLDNTIYPVSSIGEELFEPLFGLIEQSGELDDLEAIKAEIQRKPFQQVAQKHGLSKELTQKAIDMLQDLTCDMPMSPFADYASTRELPLRRFLITAGFTKMQQSKVTQLKLEGDFEEIHIIDPMKTNENKKARFKKIAEANSFAPQEVLVVGDDDASEIQAARDLGMKAVLYDTLGLFADVKDVIKINSLKELPDHI